ncbi:MAG: FHA domain-containing protein [Acidobacteriota bacterium]
MSAEIPRPLIQILQADSLLAEYEVAPNGELVLGRTQEADVVVPHRSVSPIHARIYAEGEEVYLEDLDSENGTFIDGKRVRGTVRLRHDQKILLGQHSVLRPVLVRLEDPAARMLMELGLAPDDEAQAAADEANKKDKKKRRRPRKGRDDDKAAKDGKKDDKQLVKRDADKPVPAGDGDGTKSIEKTDLDNLRRLPPPLWLGAAAAAFIVITWGLWVMLRPSATVWRTVQVAPLVISANQQLTLQSPDIHPDDKIEIAIGNEPAQVLQEKRGMIVLAVPPLPARTRGTYSIPLAVHREGREIYQRMLRYQVQPEIADYGPMDLKVGDTLVIEGGGFVGGDTDDTVGVTFGSRMVEAWKVSAERFEVNVPVLTRDVPVQVPVTAVVGGWRKPLPMPLTVHPRTPEPLDFELSTHYDPARMAWQIDTPFGLAFHVPGVPPAGSEPPLEVRAVLDNFEQIFKLAATDTNLRIGVETSRKDLALIAESKRLTRPLTLVRWPRDELGRLVRAEYGSDMMEEMVCYWLAGVWNHFLDVFSRGKALPNEEHAEPYVAVLNRLIASSIENGGDGRPEALEIARLEDADRHLLADAFQPGQDALVQLDGRWHALIENVVDPQRSYRIEVSFDLERRFTRLRGLARVALKSGVIDMAIQPVPLTGQLELGVPLRVNLEIPFDRPVGQLQMSGELTGNILEGTFTRAGYGNRRPARWRAIRVEGDLTLAERRQLDDWSVLPGQF